MVPVELTFTVTNTGPRAVTCRAVLEPLGGVPANWLVLEGRGERQLDANATHTFTVRVAPPADAATGRYSFRLNMVDVHRPDEGEVEGPEVAFEVSTPASDAPRWPLRRLVLAGAAVLLVAVAAAVAVAFWPSGRGDGEPQLSPIQDQRTFVDEPIEVPFTLSGAPAEQVTFEVSSSDPTLIVESAIEILGDDRDRSLRVLPTPRGLGSAEVTLIARDARGREDRVSFVLDVVLPFATRLAPFSASGEEDIALFGNAIALDGFIAIVGAPFSSSVAEFAGAAYVFRYGDEAWTEIGRLTASDAAKNDRFGMRVAISGDYAVVGARFSDAGLAEATGLVDVGAAYVFQRRGEAWTEVQRLTASDPSERALFGYDVAIEGDYVLVSAIRHAGSGDDSGAVYVFRLDGDTWSEVEELVASDGGESDRFGTSLAFDGRHALIAAPGSNGAGERSGSAYLFQREGDVWREVQKLVASDGAAGDHFGSAIALAGDDVLIGSASDAGGENSGAVYVFRRSGDVWNEVTKLTPSDRAPNLFFGSPLAVSGDSALIGAPAPFDDGRSSAVYLFRRRGESWTEVHKLTARGVAAENVWFGTAAAIDGEHALIGAFADEGGAVHPFRE